MLTVFHYNDIIVIQTTERGCKSCGSEKIKIVLLKRKMTVTSLAEMIGTTRSNLSNKLSRDNFSEKELKEIAEALNCDLDMNFTLRDTGEQV